MDKFSPYTYSSFIHQFDQANGAAREFILTLDEHTLLKRPDPDTWCIAECFSHLNNFGEIYLNTIQEGLETHAPAETITSSTFPPRFYWKWIIDWFEPPYKFKVKTFEPFEPGSVAGFTRHQVLEEFNSLQDRFITQLDQAKRQGYNLGKIKVGNPIFRFIGMKISECYAIVAAHQRRHIWQAGQILKILNTK